ncbi:MAG: HNH endonuclease [Planctomycetaceae bacterium]
MMDAATRQFVFLRAEGVCEYCRMRQDSIPFLTFHVEHIRAQQHLEDDTLENLALACPHCNFHKGPNLTSIDLVTWSNSSIHVAKFGTSILRLKRLASSGERQLAA